MKQRTKNKKIVLRNIIASMVCILIAVGVFIFFMLTNTQAIKLELATLSFKESKGAAIHPLFNYSEIWPSTDQASIDSVLYECILQYDYNRTTRYRDGNIDSVDFTRSGVDTTGLSCENLPLGLNVLVKREKDSTKICLLKKYNSFLDKEITLSFHADSLKQWNKDNAPDNAIKLIVLKYPFCIGNSVQLKDVELYLIPYFMGLTYNDKRLQELQLCFSDTKLRVAKYKGNTLYIAKYEEYLPSGSTVKIKVMDNDGKMQRNTYFKGRKYKEEYMIGDTMHLGDASYRIDSIGNQWDYIYLYLAKGSIETSLPSNIVDKMLPYFSKNKEYLLIDFWGTWCAPCIAGLPELRELYEVHKEKYDFVSVCYDQTSNFKKAQDIFEANNVEWEQIFDDASSKAEGSIRGKLGITTFPSFIIIDRKGNIIFKDEGVLGFQSLKTVISSL